MRRTLLALALAAGAAPAAARAGARVVVLPFEESSRVRVAAEVSGALAGRLAARRYEPVAGDPVERFLERERVRYVDSLPAPVLARLLAELGATRALFGSVLAASERPLLVAVSARLVGAGGEVLWSDVAIVREERAGGVLGSRKLTKLPEAIAEAARRLAEGAPEGGSARTIRARGPRLTFSTSGGPVAVPGPRRAGGAPSRSCRPRTTPTILAPPASSASCSRSGSGRTGGSGSSRRRSSGGPRQRRSSASRAGSTWTT